MKPVSGASLADLDRRRLRDYFVRVLAGPAPAEEENDAWQTLLCNLDLMTVSAQQTLATIDGILLFGKNPNLDRLEIQSPGKLPNTVTLEGMKAGMRYAPNQTLVNVMRDYRYIDFRGMGVREKIIPGMRAHNGTEPELSAEESRFTVRLWKEHRPA